MYLQKPLLIKQSQLTQNGLSEPHSLLSECQTAATLQKGMHFLELRDHQ